MQKPTICIIVYSNIKNDPRVCRQIMSLKDNYDITAIGLGSSDIPGITDININYNTHTFHLRRIVRLFILMTRCYNQFFWGHALTRAACDATTGIKCDLVIANDIVTLPIASELARKNGAKIIFDAHEYAPLEFENRFLWKLFMQPYIKHLCNENIHLADTMTSVCKGIAEKYTTNFSKECKIILNTPSYKEKQLKRTNPNQIRLIHHGAAMPDRNMHLMIETLELLDRRFELHFMLTHNNPRYLSDLIKKSSKNKQRVFFHPPVPMNSITDEIAKYDIGIFLLPPNNFNYEHALPNKFFEFMMAGLAIAIGPSIEMADIVNKHKCGIISKDFSPQTLSATLNKLTSSQIDIMKENSLRAAKIFNSESESAKLRAIISRTIS